VNEKPYAAGHDDLKYQRGAMDVSGGRLWHHGTLHVMA